MWILGGTLAASGVIIFVIGWLGSQSRLPVNRWAGIRTSWATTSDRSWLIAHQAAGGMLMASGLVVVVLAATLLAFGDESGPWTNGVAFASCAVMLGGGGRAARSARIAVRDDAGEATA